jgi:hypothetical protein
MSTPAEPTNQAPDPGERRPGERRLERPPGERYATEAGAPETGATQTTSTARGVAYGLAAGLALVAATVLLGGVLSVSAGLLVAAAAGGWGIGVGVRTGARASLPVGTRGWLAAVTAAGSVVVGQVGLWLYARSEGGVLSMPDYLGQTFGVLVPLQIAIACAAAWWSAR